MRVIAGIFAAIALTASSASAQFNVLAGQWGKLDPSHVRVMSYNIEDALCTTTFKGEGANSWCAMARVVAVLKPDVLILQECGDNNGNGTGSGVDSQASLGVVAQLFMNGGTDPFRGGTVNSYVKKYVSDPNYNLPYVFVSASHDGFNRNVILSRWPFADVNGDGVAQYSDISSVVNRGSQFPAGGNGGIRGFMFVEINLPDDLYAGDLVIGNAHLKSGGGSANENERIVAAKNVGFYIENFYNGSGSGVVDPTNSVNDFPQATSVLNAMTPVVIGGDWNQDFNVTMTNPSNVKSPANWLTEALNASGTDGTDRDGSNMTFDRSPRKTIDWNGQVVDGSIATNSAGKLDYLAWQDSIAVAANSFLFDVFELTTASFPQPIATYPGNPFYVTRDASDHVPVTVDFALPAAPPPPSCDADANGDNAVDAADLSVLLGQFNQTVPSGTGGDLNDDGVVNAADLSILLSNFNQPC